jgi:hypothetical protein
MFLCVPNHLPICFPWVLYDVLKVPNEFPKIVPNITSLVWGQFSPSCLQVGQKGKLHLHIKTSIWGRLSSFNVCFFGHAPIKMAHNKKIKIN